jgi:hypothetical protein
MGNPVTLVTLVTTSMANRLSRHHDTADMPSAPVWRVKRLADAQAAIEAPAPPVQ